MPQNLLEKAPELDAYLTTLGKEIKDLPPEERTASHEELRQHLDAMIAAEEELGANKSSAIDAALRNFGDARELGRQIRIESERKLLPSSLRSVLRIYLVVLLVLEVICFTVGREMGHIGGLTAMVIAGILVGIFAERRYPGQAITGGLMFVMVGGYLCPLLLMGLVLDGSASVPEWMSGLAVSSILFFSRFSIMAFLMTCGAYLATGLRERRWDILSTPQLNMAPRRLWALRHGIFSRH